MIVATKKGAIGCNINLRKNKIMLGGYFPEMWQVLIFVLLIFALGVLIPFIVYLAAFFPKQKAFENELGNWVKAQYGLTA